MTMNYETAVVDEFDRIVTYEQASPNPGGLLARFLAALRKRHPSLRFAEPIPGKGIFVFREKDFAAQCAISVRQIEGGLWRYDVAHHSFGGNRKTSNALYAQHTKRSKSPDIAADTVMSLIGGSSEYHATDVLRRRYEAAADAAAFEATEHINDYSFVRRNVLMPGATPSLDIDSQEQARILVHFAKTGYRFGTEELNQAMEKAANAAERFLQMAVPRKLCLLMINERAGRVYISQADNPYVRGANKSNFSLGTYTPLEDINNKLTPQAQERLALLTMHPCDAPKNMAEGKATHFDGVGVRVSTNAYVLESVDDISFVR